MTKIPEKKRERKMRNRLTDNFDMLSEISYSNIKNELPTKSLGNLAPNITEEGLVKSRSAPIKNKKKKALKEKGGKRRRKTADEILLLEKCLVTWWDATTQIWLRFSILMSLIPSRICENEIGILPVAKCFIQDSQWQKETVDYIKANTQLSYNQIYKWGWDQRK
jgi:hypothetical protein